MYFEHILPHNSLKFKRFVFGILSFPARKLMAKVLALKHEKEKISKR